jgi:hypothetical protein
VYLTKNFAHKVLDDTYIAYGSRASLPMIRELDLQKARRSSGVTVVKYQSPDEYTAVSGGRSQVACSSEMSATYYHNNSGCKNDRQVYVRAYTWLAVNGNSYTPSVISAAKGKIRNWLCNWNWYETLLYTRNCSLAVSVTINDGTLNYPVMTFPDYNGIVDEPEHIIVNGPVGNAIIWQGGAVPSITFRQIHEEASSRGVNGNWAILHCP